MSRRSSLALVPREIHPSPASAAVIVDAATARGTTIRRRADEGREPPDAPEVRRQGGANAYPVSLSALALETTARSIRARRAAYVRRRRRASLRDEPKGCDADTRCTVARSRSLIKNIFPRRSFRGGDCEAPQTERAEDRALRRHTAPARTLATRRRARSTATGASTLTSRRSFPSSGASSRLSATSWATPRLPVPVADPLASSRFPSRHSPRAAHSAPPRRRPAFHLVSPSTWPSPR